MISTISPSLTPTTRIQQTTPTSTMLHLTMRSSASTLQLVIMVRGKETNKYENIDFVSEASHITLTEWHEWDDNMKTLKIIRPAKQKKIMRDRVSNSNFKKILQERAEGSGGTGASQLPYCND